MRIVRFLDETGTERHGEWLDDSTAKVIEGELPGEFQVIDQTVRIGKLLAPIVPRAILCIGLNYRKHAEESGAKLPEYPVLFMKLPGALQNPGDPIVLPAVEPTEVDYECELAVVIGKAGRWIEPDQAKKHILGYTIANDVTDRVFQREDLLWTRGKGFDTFAPIGPWIETDFNTADAIISCRINGDLRQMASTRDMVFLVEQLIAFASSFMTLMPGDVLLTGTPEGVSKLEAGDTVDIEIEGIGKLTNPVILSERAQ